MIVLETADLRLRLLSRGATLAGLWHRDDPRSLVLGFSDPEDHARVPVYAGAIVGPLANRLAGGTARIGDQVVQMARNENGETALHSGPDGLDAREWDVHAQSQTQAHFRCNLPDGSCGLPGNRRIDAIWRLDGHDLSLEITATTDAPTLMNITAHPYWAVNAHARLRLAADSYLPVTPANLPSGEIADVADTRFDLCNPKPIPAGLDHNFVLAHAPRTTPLPVAWLDMPHYSLRLETTAPGLQVYSGGFLPDLPQSASLGWPIKPGSGLALEPQFWPDAPNHPGFPSVRLDPGQTWRQITRYCLIF